MLTNAAVKHEPVITMILFGQPSLATTLKLPAMIPLAQRIGTWITMEGLNEEETGEYIDWHMKNAGSSNEVFPAATFISTAIIMYVREDELVGILEGKLNPAAKSQ